jgi:hypothetical protein
MADPLVSSLNWLSRTLYNEAHGYQTKVWNILKFLHNDDRKF